MTGPVGQALAWALLHSLWQQGVVAAGLWLLLRRTAGWPSSRRYAVACGGLALGVLLPIATFLALAGWTAGGASPTAEPLLPAAFSGIPEGPPALQPSDAAEAGPAAPLLPDATWDELLAHLVWAWMIGVLVFGGRFAGGWIYLQQMRWLGAEPAEETWRRRLEELAPRMGVFSPVWLYESQQVKTPTLIGWLRPVILLPVGMLTGLSPAQVEAVLAHELAHIRRHDYAVNLVQSLAEVFFFHSPGVWVMSRWIREEREFCCDDLAITVTGDRLALGKALARLGGAGSGIVPRPALAATGGSLLFRIRRIVLPRGDAPACRSLVAPALGLALAIGGLFPAVGGPLPEEEYLPEAPTPARHETFLKGRQPLTLHYDQITLGEFSEALTAATGIGVDLPPGAASQPIRPDFREVSADMIIVSVFNLLEMDHQVHPVTGRIQASYWEGIGPRREEAPRVSLELFHRRQAMFRGLKHDVRWTGHERLALREGLRRLTELSGIPFAYSDPSFADLPVDVHLPRGTVREALHQMLRPHGLSYRYLDDSTILIQR